MVKFRSQISKSGGRSRTPGGSGKVGIGRFSSRRTSSRSGRRTGSDGAVFVEESTGKVFSVAKPGTTRFESQAAFETAQAAKVEAARAQSEEAAKQREAETVAKAESKFQETISSPINVQKQFFKPSIFEALPIVGGKITQSRIDANQERREQAGRNLFAERTFEAQSELLQTKREAATQRRADVKVGNIQEELQTGVTEGRFTTAEAEERFTSRVATEVEPEFISSQLRDIGTASALKTERASRPIAIPKTESFILSRRISPTSKDTGKTLTEFSKTLEAERSPVAFKIGSLDPLASVKTSSFATDKVESLTVGGAVKGGAQLGLIFAGASTIKGISSVGLKLVPKSVSASQLGRLGIGIASVEAGGLALSGSTSQLSLGEQGRKLRSQFGKEFTKDITSLSEKGIKQFGVERGLSSEQIAGFRDIAERTKIPRVAKLVTKVIGAEAIGNIVGAASTPGKTIGEAFRSRTLAGFGEGFVGTKGALEFSRPKSFKIASLDIPVSAIGLLPSVKKGETGLDINVGTIIPSIVGGVAGAATAGGFAVGEFLGKKAGATSAVEAIGFGVDFPELPGDVATPLLFPKSLAGTPKTIPTVSFTKVFNKDVDGKVRGFSFEEEKGVLKTKTTIKGFEVTKEPTTQKPGFVDIKAKDISKGFGRSPTKAPGIKDITISSRDISITKGKAQVPTVNINKALSKVSSQVPSKVDTKALSKVDTNVFLPAKAETKAVSFTDVKPFTDIKTQTFTETFTDTTTFTFTPPVFPPILPSGGGGGRGFGRGRGFKLPSKFTPSLRAVALNIRSPTKRGLAGIGARPILSKAKPVKRRKKKKKR